MPNLFRSVNCDINVTFFWYEEHAFSFFVHSETWCKLFVSHFFFISRQWLTFAKLIHKAAYLMLDLSFKLDSWAHVVLGCCSEWFAVYNVACWNDNQVTGYFHSYTCTEFETGTQVTSYSRVVFVTNFLEYTVSTDFDRMQRNLVSLFEIKCRHLCFLFSLIYCIQSYLPLDIDLCLMEVFNQHQC